MYLTEEQKKEKIKEALGKAMEFKQSNDLLISKKIIDEVKKKGIKINSAKDIEDVFKDIKINTYAHEVGKEFYFYKDVFLFFVESRY